LLGYDADTVDAGDEAGDVIIENQRRLLAMAVGRARQGVVLGYRPSAPPSVADFIASETYDLVEL
jgi:hypothetical protein